MSIVVPAKTCFTAPFAPIGLKQLEATAGMLERIDNKYVIGQNTLRLAIPQLADHFDILDIDGRRNFTYDTCYFDDPGCRSYFDHHQSRCRRIKVRMRKYVEAGLCFVEIKLKDKRGMTVKKRLKTDPRKFGVLDDDAEAFIRETYSAHYKREFPLAIERNLDMRYRRMTLVGKNGGERMTIDNGMRFFMSESEHAVDPWLFIIEAKSAKGNGAADKILRRLHQHPTKHVSKYCTGVATMREGTKHNNFRRALKKLGLLEQIGVKEQSHAAKPAKIEARWHARPAFIARAIYFGDKVLILDEPTSALGGHQA